MFNPHGSHGKSGASNCAQCLCSRQYGPISDEPRYSLRGSPSGLIGWNAPVRAVLPAKQKRELAQDARYTTDWIANFVRQITSRATKKAEVGHG